MRQSIRVNLVALCAGLLFGAGLTLSGMVDPVKVLGFLDLFGDWDPTLAFVMGGGLLVYIPGYQWLIRRRQRPVCENQFHLPAKDGIDKPLIIGAAIFGIGWGIGGICPGPALANLSGNLMGIWVFVATMLLGMWLGARSKSE